MITIQSRFDETDNNITKRADSSPTRATKQNQSRVTVELPREHRYVFSFIYDTTLDPPETQATIISIT